MGLFLYQGKTSQGRLVRGQLEASTEMEARVKLRAQRIIPIKVVEKGTQKKTGFDFQDIFKSEPRVKAKDLQIFTRQFATLINSGIPIVQSLDILGAQTQSPSLKKVLIKVKANVEGGKRLGDSIEGWPLIFDRLYV